MPQPLKNDRWRIPKSRYASNSTYISQDPRLRKEYLDPDLVVNEDIKKRLMDDGMDELLATHFAHLFIRDPLVIFAEDLEELHLNKADHFENLQSTNWQHMRFKPPPPDKDDVGWRVEFRSMEIQMTDFENAAFSIFIVLVTRAILSFDLNFYIPIQKTTENMETAHARNAVLDRKFYFRKDPFPRRVPKQQQQSSHGSEFSSGASSAVNTPPPSPPLGPVELEYDLMTLSDIVNGSADGSFPGLIPLVESYLDSVNVDVETRCSLAIYLDLIRKRADGTLWTGARWMREFVASHPGYKHDSVVSEEICFDLVKAVDEMAVKEGRNGTVGWELLRGKRE
jgi:glutamate--cysteine ligase catalytic subunit